MTDSMSWVFSHILRWWPFTGTKKSRSVPSKTCKYLNLNTANNNPLQRNNNLILFLRLHYITHCLAPEKSPRGFKEANVCELPIRWLLPGSYCTPTDATRSFSFLKQPCQRHILSSWKRCFKNYPLHDQVFQSPEFIIMLCYVQLCLKLVKGRSQAPLLTLENVLFLLRIARMNF